MATIVHVRRPVKAATEDARGVCGLTIHIDGTAYRGRPLPLDPRSDFAKVYRLSKQAGQGEVYDVCQDVIGTVSCSCPDFQFRRQGTGTVCKHGAALVALGLLARKGGAR